MIDGEQVAGFVSADSADSGNFGNSGNTLGVSYLAERSLALARLNEVTAFTREGLTAEAAVAARIVRDHLLRPATAISTARPSGDDETRAQLNRAIMNGFRGEHGQEDFWWLTAIDTFDERFDDFGAAVGNRLLGDALRRSGDLTPAINAYSDSCARLSQAIAHPDQRSPYADLQGEPMYRALIDVLGRTVEAGIEDARVAAHRPTGTSPEESAKNAAALKKAVLNLDLMVGPSSLVTHGFDALQTYPRTLRQQLVGTVRGLRSTVVGPGPWSAGGPAVKRPSAVSPPARH